jgi:hypothetical protein
MAEKEPAMPTTSQLWFVTKKAALVIGALVLAHAVAAPRDCSGCGVKSSRSQAAAANPAGNGALGGPDTKIKNNTLKNTNATGMGSSDDGMRAKGFNPQPDPPSTLMRMDTLMDTPRLHAPGAIGGRAGGGSMRVR